MGRFGTVAAMAAVVVLGACSDARPTSPTGGAPRADVQAMAGIWAAQEEGQTGPGSTYGLYLPNGWNGRLVVYAHGYTSPFQPVALPAVQALRDALGAQGFAVAYSSFSENGYAVKDGIQRTHQLKGLFAERFAEPLKTYLVGHSLGGLITLALAEKYPSQYAGALPMCGVVGGTTAEIQYMGHVRTLWDYFFPGTLGGDIQGIPVVSGFAADVQGPVVSAILGNPGKAVALASIAQAPVPFADIGELIASYVNIFGFQYNGASDLTERVNGHVAFDNAATSYAGALPAPLLVDINQRVRRWEVDPSARSWLDHNYDPSGKLRIPTVTLHTTRDPVVPFFHEGLLAQAVSAAGYSDNLVQRSIVRHGHCTFTTAETFGAFQALVGWVEYGVKPAP